MTALGEHEQEAVRGILDGLERDVELLLELGPEEVPVTVVAGGREIDFGVETKMLLEQVASLSDRVELTVTETSERGRWPKTTVGGELVYHGLPWGYELTTLVGAIAEAGRAESSLSAELTRRVSAGSSATLPSRSTSRRPVRTARRRCCWRSVVPSPHRMSRRRRSRRRSLRPTPTATASCPSRRSWSATGLPGSVRFPKLSFVERLLRVAAGTL